MIRIASRDDLPEIIRMGELFADLVGLPFDEISAIQTAHQLMSADDGEIFIDEGAMAGVMAYPLFFDEKYVIAQELFYWVDEDKRGNGVAAELLDAMELWAEDAGASRITMLAMECSQPDLVGKLYQRRGYVPFERTFVKVF